MMKEDEPGKDSLDPASPNGEQGARTRRISLSPLHHKEFRLYIFVRFFYIMALRMVATVVGWQLFQLTKDSFSIGIAGLSEFIPVFALALYAGHVIDRSDKRTLLLKGILAYGICVVGLIIITPALL